jgi:hypothetical protein
MGRNRAAADARENLIIAERPILSQPEEDGAGREVELTFVTTNVYY